MNFDVQTLATGVSRLVVTSVMHLGVDTIRPSISDTKNMCVYDNVRDGVK